jgi:hypothetical protein
MVSDADIIKLTDDGQVTKRILREGAGTQPEPNNTVTGKKKKKKKKTHTHLLYYVSCQTIAFFSPLDKSNTLSFVAIQFIMTLY